MTTMTRLEIIEAVISEVQPQLAEITKLGRELSKLKNTVAAQVAAVASKLAPYEDDNFDDEEVDVLTDRINDVAYQLDMTWQGNDEWNEWTVGEEVDFWVPSTC